MKRRDFLRSGCAAITAALAAPHLSAVQPDHKKTAVRELAVNKKEIRLLQFTDIHFFAGLKDSPEHAVKGNSRTADAMRQLTDQTKPQLVIVTGDFWHNNPDGRGAEFMDYAVSQLETLGVPWIYTWGNHDELTDYAVGHRRMTEAKNSLYGGAEDDGNYLLRLTRDGKPIMEIFCINTHREGMRRAEQDWLQTAAGPSKDYPFRMAVMHIPIKQYAEVWENGSARGFIGEDVCFEQESGDSLEVLARCGVQAVICGHDHVNDYEGTIQNVRLIYGRSSGLHSYGALTLAKGGKLYTFNSETGGLTWQSLPYRGDPWVPKPDERVDRRKKDT
mgnify:CR=1 FL=1